MNYYRTNWMNFKQVLSLFIGLILLGCTHQKPILNFESDELKIEQLTTNTFVHISYLQTEDFGNVACNGLIVVDDGEAIVYDTPVNDEVANTLLDWLIEKQKIDVKAIVVTHFHNDCLGGLNAFHALNIPSYASSKTVAVCKEKKSPIPQNAFKDAQKIQVGNSFVFNEYFGPGHTNDNIVGYFPKEKVLFGGCLIKELGAGKGYLADAKTDEWSSTVVRVKDKFDSVKVVVPGHGKAGGVDLLDYTIKLFDE